jgi:hypothetical protein
MELLYAHDRQVTEQIRHEKQFSHTASGVRNPLSGNFVFMGVVELPDCPARLRLIPGKSNGNALAPESPNGGLAKESPLIFQRGKQERHIPPHGA